MTPMYTNTRGAVESLLVAEATRKHGLQSTRLCASLANVPKRLHDVKAMGGEAYRNANTRLYRATRTQRSFIQPRLYIPLYERQRDAFVWCDRYDYV